MQQLRDALDILKQSALEQEDLPFDPSGTSGLGTANNDMDGIVSDRSTSRNDTVQSQETDITCVYSRNLNLNPKKEKKKKKIHFHYTLYKKGYPIDQACYIYLTKPEEHHELILLACSSKKHKRKRQKSPSLPNTYVFILYVCRCIHPLAMHVCAFSFCYSLRPPADSWYQNYTKCHRHRTRGIPIHCDEEGKPRPKKIRSKKEKNKTKKGRSVIILR